MATLLGKSCSFVNRMFFEVCLLVILVVVHFGFEGGTVVLILPDHCSPFTSHDLFMSREALNLGLGCVTDVSSAITAYYGIKPSLLFNLYMLYFQWISFIRLFINIMFALAIISN